jgi:hypothetical protein
VVKITDLAGEPTVYKMMMIRQSSLLILLVAHLGGAAGVQAAPAPDAQFLKLAKQEYDKGREAYLAGYFRKAIEHYRRADAIKHSPVLFYNIGIAYEKLGLHNEAREYYRRLLREAPDSKGAARARQRLKNLPDPLATKAPPLVINGISRGTNPGTASSQPNATSRPVGNTSPPIEKKIKRKDSRPPPKHVYPWLYQPFRRGGLSIGAGGAVAISLFREQSGQGELAPAYGGAVFGRVGWFFNESFGLHVQGIVAIQYRSFDWEDPQTGSTPYKDTLAFSGSLGLVAQYFVMPRWWISGGVLGTYDSTPVYLSTGGMRAAPGAGVSMGSGLEVFRFHRVGLNLEALVTLHFPQVNDETKQAAFKYSLNMMGAMSLVYY